jgi:hypothetical protein
MLPLAFNVHGEMAGDTPKIMHPEPLPHLLIDLPTPALVSNDEETIDIQNGYGGDNVLIWIMDNERKSVNT